VWGRRAEDPFRGLRAGPVRSSPHFVSPPLFWPFFSILAWLQCQDRDPSCVRKSIELNGGSLVLTPGISEVDSVAAKCPVTPFDIVSRMIQNLCFIASVYRNPLNTRCLEPRKVEAPSVLGFDSKYACIVRHLRLWTDRGFVRRCDAHKSRCTYHRETRLAPLSAFENVVCRRLSAAYFHDVQFTVRPWMKFECQTPIVGRSIPPAYQAAQWHQQRRRIAVSHSSHSGTPVPLTICPPLVKERPVLPARPKTSSDKSALAYHPKRDRVH